MSNGERSGFGALSIPQKLQRELRGFCRHVAETFGARIVSTTVTGSAAGPDFLFGTSDVNVLVVFSELELNDLQAVAAQTHRWWRRSRISPRFISERNLLAMPRYFPIDFWTMQQHHVVLSGADVLADIRVAREDLLWQLHHEVKGLRTRVKQQFWRTWKSVRFAETNLLASLTTLVHLLKVALYLKDLRVPELTSDVLSEARDGLGIDSAFGERMLRIKRGETRLRKADIFASYEGFLEVIRQLDDLAETLTV